MCGPSMPKMSEAEEEAIAANTELAKERWAWYKDVEYPLAREQMQRGLKVLEDAYADSTRRANFQDDLTSQYNERYWNTQVPLENRLIRLAETYGTEEEQERMAGEAKADVQRAFDSSAAQMRRGLAGRGINLSSPAAIMAERYANTDRALAEVSAMNKTREAAKQMQWTRLGEVAALGRGLPSFGATSAGLAQSAGGQATQAGTGGLGLVGQQSSIANGAYGSTSNLWNSAGNMAINGYNARVNAANVEASADPFNTILGAAAGVGTSWALNRYLKP